MGLLKTLFIVRHGKSAWDQTGISDIDRPLKDRGIRNAYEIAETLKKKHTKPDAIYSSPAARALNTAIIFSRVLEVPSDHLYVKEDLYLADLSEIIDVIKETDTSINSVMVFGHNPGFTDLANYLSELRLQNLPTAGLVCLQFNIKTWDEIDKRKLASSYFDFPADN